MDKHKKYFTNDKVVNKRINDFLDKYYMRDKGKFFCKERWFSLCSEHQQYNKECNTCNIGTWGNIWRTNIEKVIFIISPRLCRLLKFKKVETIDIKKQDEPKKYYRRNQRKN
jgi:hypothetical protein